MSVKDVVLEKPFSLLYEEQKVKLCECNVEIFHLLFFFNRYILYHNGYKPCEHRDIERSNVPLSIPEL